MKDNMIFVKHIMESINFIEQFTEGFTEKEFLKDFKTQAAVIEMIQIIGEASKNISEDFRSKYPDIPWRQMARTRDKLIHGYFSVDLNLTWDVIRKDIPDLKEKISKIINENK